MGWKIVLTPKAEKQLSKLDQQIQRRINSFLYERLAKLPDPRILSDTLEGGDEEESRFRVGDYRLICRSEEGKLLVLVLRMGHRKEVYRK